MKNIKNFNDFNRINESNENIPIDIWHVPYEAKKVGNNQFTIENPFGTNAIDILKRKNDYGETSGSFQNFFTVDVEEDSIKITLLPDILDMFDGDEEEALIDALKTIENYYNDVGWEFLN